MQSQQAVTHDPRVGLTPSQLRAADARIARLARMASRTAIATPPSREPEPIPSAPPQIEPPSFKEPWFSILSECDGPLRIDAIQKVVLARFPNVTRADLLSPRRTNQVVRPRHIAMYLAKTLTPKSYMEIGRGFGGRDHSSTLHAVNKIAALMEVDADLAADIADMSKLLQSREVA